jgi:hypothetical protein
MIIERVGYAVARLFFLDEAHVETDIPEGFEIHDVIHGDAPVPTISGVNFFVLGWTDNYDIFYHGTLILQLANQRHWNASGPAGRQVYYIDLLTSSKIRKSVDSNINVDSRF